MNIKVVKLGILGFTVVCLTMFGLARGYSSKSEHIKENTGKANVETFVAKYKKWQKESIKKGADRYLNIGIGWMKGVSTEEPIANGRTRIDLRNGEIALRVNGLPEGEWQLWLIENRPGLGHSTLPDPGDGIISVGTFISDGKLSKLNTQIDTNTLANFKIDRVVVTRAGNNPKDFVLTGAPTLFERLQLNSVKPVDTEANANSAMNRSLLDYLSPVTVQADSTATDALIAKGRQLFNSETFGGNGRTCATCHPEANNFTIDPAFIAKLPATDPLFVAEFTPALANNFENPTMLRKLGLILVNADGFDDLSNKFVLRSVPYLLTLSTSTAPPDPNLGIDFTTNGLNFNPVERLGWSGDGSTGSGSLREFPIGAIIQHFTKTLNRTSGTDFRLPTDEELDALEAFQLSLGRHEDIDLTTLVINNELATKGQDMYLDTGAFAEKGHKNCNACHFTAGATTGIGDFSALLDSAPLGFNSNQSTAVNRLQEVTDLNLPPDGGFGRLLLPDGAFGNLADVPGTGVIPVQEFNTTSLIEAADTGPFFHNNVVATLEESIAFYGSDAYQNGIDSVGNVDLGGFVPVEISKEKDDSEVLAISALLRVLNVLENIRSSITMETQAKQLSGDSQKDLIRLAMADNQDAIDVITAGALANQSNLPEISKATKRLIAANRILKQAVNLPNSQANKINALLDMAVKKQRTARNTLVDPTTLPQSFQN
jgi:cytochrome c peroxidase